MTYADLSPEERARLVAAYGAGLAAGSGGPWMLDDDPQTIALIGAIEDDWFRALETWQASRPRWPLHEPMPAWLRAEIDLHTALGDARPPEGWLKR